MLDSELDPDPIAQFAAWFADAQARGARQPEAVALATATPLGVPSVRMVLLKGWDERGFRFFTNRDSHKGRELADNPAAAMLLYWRELGRQVRITGRTRPVGRAEARAYFQSRPRESQVGAAVSPQSRVIPSREQLDTAFRELLERHHSTALPLPAFWGGYILRPAAIEFWEHQDHRLHDRIRYRRRRGAWIRERLAP